jgi:hypothetical protein
VDALSAACKSCFIFPISSLVIGHWSLVILYLLPMTAGILTISDSASAGIDEDHGG